MEMGNNTLNEFMFEFQVAIPLPLRAIKHDDADGNALCISSRVRL